MEKEKERSIKLLQLLIKKNMIQEACMAIDNIAYREFLYKQYNL